VDAPILEKPFTAAQLESALRSLLQLGAAPLERSADEQPLPLR
jgi:hypothetical protein